MKRNKIILIFMSIIMFVSIITLFPAKMVTFSANYTVVEDDTGFIYHVYDNYAVAIGYGNNNIAGAFNSLSFKGISPYINNVPVHYISGTALTRTNINELSIPDTVYEIMDGGIMGGAFSRTDITTVTIPKNVNKIGANAFYECKKLNTIFILNPKCEIKDFELYKDGMTISNSSNGFSGIIYGYKNSKAHEYAQKCNYNFISLDNNELLVSSTTTKLTTTTTSNRSYTSTTKVTTTTTAKRFSTSTAKIPITTTTSNQVKLGAADGDLSYFDKFDVDKATIKPTISISRIELSVEEARKNPYQTINFTINDTKNETFYYGFHVTWDDRLYIYDGRNLNINNSAFFTGVFKNDNKKTDSKTLDANLRFTIPSYCKPGDIYPIRIMYINKNTASDEFNTLNKDYEGCLAEAWTFTRGIIHGYIKIKDDEVTTTNTNYENITTNTTSTTILKKGWKGKYDYDPNNKTIYLEGNVSAYEFYEKNDDINNIIAKKGTILPESCKKLFIGCTNVENIDLSNADASNVTDMTSMFEGLGSLTSLDLSNFDTSNVTDMTNMFNRLSSIKSLDLSNFNTSNATNMCGMFCNCNSLISLDLSNFNTSNVTNMEGMFGNCNSLTSLDLSNFDTSNVKNMQDMFYNCNLLISLNLSNFNTSKVYNFNRMFFECISLPFLDLSSFKVNTNEDMMEEMFYGCRSLKRILASDNWTFASQKTSSYMFVKCYSLIGGNGTVFSYDKYGIKYASLDTDEHPGLFTNIDTYIPDIDISTTTTMTTTSIITTTTSSDTTTSIDKPTTFSSTTTSNITTTSTIKPSANYNLGDVNNDGYINAVDASSVLAYYARISTNQEGNYDEEQILAADVNHDGLINSVDASNMLAYYAYISTTKEDIISLETYMKKANRY